MVQQPKSGLGRLIVELLDHTPTCTPGRTPLDYWSARCKGRHLLNTQTRERSSITSVGFELAVPAVKPLQTYVLAARPSWSAYLSLRTFFGVHLTSVRLSGTKLLLVYESSSERSSECFRKHVCLAEDVCVYVCVNIVRNVQGYCACVVSYGKGCKFFGCGRSVVERFLKSVHG
jgi:hypothetical protein